MKKIEINKIYNQNCIDGMSTIPKNKIDLVITDPPFAINFKAKKANYNRTSSRVLTGYNEITPEDYYDFTFAWMQQPHEQINRGTFSTTSISNYAYHLTLSDS